MSELKINQLSLNYFGHADSLHSVTHVFKQGVNVVYAEEGSGKTSLLKAIAGLVSYHHGSISLDDKDLVYGALSDVSMVFDDLGLFEKRSALYNLQYPLKIRKVPKENWGNITDKWLDEFGISQIALDSKAFRLSPVLRAKLALCRAFMRDTPVLLLDDPLKNLSSYERRKLFLELSVLMQKRNGIVIYATDDWQEAVMLSAPTIILSYGYLVESGLPEVISKSPKCLSTARTVSPFYNVYKFENDLKLFGQDVDFLSERIKSIYNGKDLYVGFPPEALSDNGVEFKCQFDFVSELATFYGVVYLYECNGERIYSTHKADRLFLDVNKITLFDGVTEFAVQ